MRTSPLTFDRSRSSKPSFGSVASTEYPSASSRCVSAPSCAPTSITRPAAGSKCRRSHWTVASSRACSYGESATSTGSSTTDGALTAIV
ncbi:hypothetical protein ACWCOV_40260 [Kribbella sp. NPDC002412]